MIKVSIQFDKYKREDGTHCVRLRMAGNGSAKIRINVAVPESHWDASTKQVKKAYGSRGKEELNIIIRRERNRLEDFIREINADRWGFTCSKIKQMYHSQTSNTGDSVYAYYDKEIERLKKIERNGLARARKETLNKLKSFKKTLYFYEITFSFLEWLNDQMILQKLSANARSKHLRDLRAIVNHADKSGVEVSNPFRKFKMPSEMTQKRHISIKTLNEIRKLELTGPDKYARDFFLFSFYMGGMAFKDVYYTTKENIEGEYIIYKRRKIGDQRRSPILKTIIPDPAKEFLEIKKPPNTYNSYMMAMRRMNRRLRSMKVESGIKITMHVARHSWNMAAKSLGFSYQLRREIMGYKSAEGAMQNYEDTIQEQKDECVLKVAALLG